MNVQFGQSTDITALADFIELGREDCGYITVQIAGGSFRTHLVAALRAAANGRVEQRKMAPVQGYSAGIPWSLHLEAYDAYCKKWGRQQALIEGGCRGGFGTEELDGFIPGWRARAAEIAGLREEVAKLSSQSDSNAEDAARWRATVGSARVRVLGSAGLLSDLDPYGNAFDGFAHIGIELWTRHESGNTPADAVELLTKYADIAIFGANKGRS